MSHNSRLGTETYSGADVSAVREGLACSLVHEDKCSRPFLIHELLTVVDLRPILFSFMHQQILSIRFSNTYEQYCA